MKPFSFIISVRVVQQNFIWIVSSVPSVVSLLSKSTQPLISGLEGHYLLGHGFRDLEIIGGVLEHHSSVLPIEVHVECLVPVSDCVERSNAGLHDETDACDPHGWLTNQCYYYCGLLSADCIPVANNRSRSQGTPRVDWKVILLQGWASPDGYE